MKSSESQESYKDSGIGSYGISTLVGYLMPNLVIIY